MSQNRIVIYRKGNEGKRFGVSVAGAEDRLDDLTLNFPAFVTYINYKKKTPAVLCKGTDCPVPYCNAKN